MNDYPVEFVLKLCSVLYSIISYCIYTYKKISGKTVTFTVVKSYNIGEVVMLEIFLIHIKNIIVGTENNIDLANPSDLTFSDKSKPFII